MASYELGQIVHCSVELCMRIAPLMSLNTKTKRKNNELPRNSDGHFTTQDGVVIRKLYISNLSRNTSETDLITTMNNFGTVIDIKIIRPNIITKPSFAFITFRDPAEATRVLFSRHKIYVKHRKVFISPADSWHQPVVLPNGKLILNSKDNPAQNTESEEPDLTINDIVPIQPEDDSPISKLNDDCLLMIFSYVPINHRLQLHKVSRRWNSVVMSMWYTMKKLDFTAPPLCQEALTDKLLLSYISLCPYLTTLDIATDDHSLSTNALILIAKNCPNLEHINVREVRTSKRTLAFFGKSCPQLKSFSSDVCSNNHDAEMAGLVKNCHNLERISLKYGSTPSGHWLKFLKPPLKSLSLELYDFNPEFLMEGIKKAKDSLEELKIISCDSLRSRDIEMIVTTLPNLKQLTLAGGSFSDFHSHALLPITRLKHLAQLDLHNNSFVCDKFMEGLSENCTKLQRLQLSGIDDEYLTNQGLNRLPKLTGLTYLTLVAVSKLTDANLKSISLKIKGLKHLGIMGCTSVTDEGSQSVVKHCAHLETFDVSGCRNVTNLTVIAAAAAMEGSGRKLKIIAGDSGIHSDVNCPSSITIDPSSSMMSQYPGTMFIIDPEIDNDAFFNNLLLEDELEDLYSDDEDYCVYEDYLLGYSDDSDGY